MYLSNSQEAEVRSGNIVELQILGTDIVLFSPEIPRLYSSRVTQNTLIGSIDLPMNSLPVPFRLHPERLSL